MICLMPPDAIRIQPASGTHPESTRQTVISTGHTTMSTSYAFSFHLTSSGKQPLFVPDSLRVVLVCPIATTNIGGRTPAIEGTQRL